MEEQELKHIWKHSSVKEEITINMKQLMNGFKNKMENREGIVRRRDMREYIAGSIGIIYYGYVFVKLPLSVSKFGAFLIIVSMTYFLWRLYNNRKSKFTRGLFLPIREQLQQQKEFMQRQSKLLGTVHQMLIPIFLSFLVFMWGDWAIAMQNDAVVEFILVRKLAAKIISTLFLLLFGIYIIRLNKRAAKVNWEPLIEDVDGILERLDNEK